MFRKLCVLGCFVLVFALSGLATAAAEQGYIDDQNYNLSFEDDVNGNQIWCKIEHLTGKVLAWNDNGVDFANAEIACADACDSPGCICKNDPCTDGIIKLTMGQEVSDANVIVWQSLDPAYDANVIIKENYLYTVSYDAFEWNEQTLKAYLFYGDIPGPNISENPDVNVIVVNQPSCTYQYQTFSIEFAALPGQPYIGKPLGIRFFERGPGWFWIDNIRVHFQILTKAHFPNPADAAINVSKNAVIKWAPGVFAQKKGGHDVYLGNTWADVNSATTATAGIFKGNQDTNSYDPNGAGPMLLGRTYYWRIDEVNSSTKWRGDIWSFDIEGFATNPYPADGAVDVLKEVLLKWTRGTDAKYHDVYFGTSASAVEAATTATSGIYKTRLNKGTEQYDTTSLNPQVNKWYFWRIDEVNTMTVKGYVWDFRVANWIVVDDFDSYANTTALRVVWKDGTTTPPGGNANVWINTDANFADGDGNSMKFEYWNDGSKVNSETKRTYSTVQNWSYAGNSVTDLELSYYGDVDNGQDPPMYVKLSDGTKTAQVNCPALGEVNTPWAEQWQHTWNIPLKNFSDKGVTLSKISSIILGVGDLAAEGGGKKENGTLYFDDLKLWPPRCFLDYKPTADITNDCRVDINDLAIVVEDWCKSGQWAAPSPPDDNGVVRYQMNEGSGNLIANSGTFGSSYNITRGNSYLWDAGSPSQWTGSLGADPNNNPLWVNDPNRGWCLSFDGELGLGRPEEPGTYLGGDYLLIPPLNLNSNHVSITAWVKPNPFWIGGAWQQNLSYTGLVHQRAMPQWSIPGNTLAAGLSYGGDTKGNYNDKVAYVWNDNAKATWSFDTGMLIDDFKWNFLALTIEPTKATVYKVNASKVMTSATNTVANTPEELDSYTLIAGDNGYYQRFFAGRMSDVRIYNRVLTVNEIMGLGGASGHIYLPLVSDADLCVGNKNPTYPNVDDQIEFCDYSKLAAQWLTESLWPPKP